MVNHSKSPFGAFSTSLCWLIKGLAILFGAFAALEGFGGIPRIIQKAKEGRFEFTEIGILIGIGFALAGIVIVFCRTRRGAAFMIAGGLLSGMSLFLSGQAQGAKSLRIISNTRFLLFSLPFILFGLGLLFCERRTKK
jgi:uncharacterized membrane protein